VRRRLLWVLVGACLFLTNCVVVVAPSPLSNSAEVANPHRGSYRWNGFAPQPAGWPILDSYMRYSWRDLEPTRGNYNFSAIDAELAAAKARGGKFGFRIEAARTGVVGTAVPGYLVPLMQKAWYFDLNGTHNLAPDWNDPDYLGRLQALINALGNRYDHDPRVGWVDISGYGDYSEWHVSRWPYPSPTGAGKITSANANRIVDMNVAAFPHKILLMQHQTVVSDSNDHEAFLYALRKYPKVGIRNDCLGSSWFTTEMRYLYSHYPVVAVRWKQAPLMTEPCDGNFAAMAPQIAEFHVANIGNGNIGNLSTYSAAARRQWEADNIRSGYRFVLRSVSLPALVTRGRSYGVSSSWSNTGVTPAYDPWNVKVQLRAGSRVVWTGTSSLVLTHFLPGNRTVHDTFTIPTSVPKGTYRAVLIVTDPSGYYAPLRLAVEGRASGGHASDGSYALGTIHVE